MPNKIIRIIKFILYDLIFVVIYGLILYFVFIWLSGYSLLYAYLGNLALILLVLALDEYMIRMLQSKDIVMGLIKENNKEKNYSSIQSIMDNTISFKTELYLFYVFILIFSQIIDFSPALVSNDFSKFILANSYSILLLIAFDRIIQNFSNDRKRMKKVSANFKKSLNENQD
jgi:hypothetical protein